MQDQILQRQAEPASADTPIARNHSNESHAEEKNVYETLDEVLASGDSTQDDDESFSWDTDEWDSFDDEPDDRERKQEATEELACLWVEQDVKGPIPKDTRVIAEFDPVPLVSSNEAADGGNQELETLASLLQVKIFTQCDTLTAALLKFSACL